MDANNVLWIINPQVLLNTNFFPNVITNGKINVVDTINISFKWALLFFIISLFIGISNIVTLSLILLVFILLLSLFNYGHQEISSFDPKIDIEPKEPRYKNLNYNYLSPDSLYVPDDAQIQNEKDLSKMKNYFILDNPVYNDFGNPNSIHNLTEKNNNVIDLNKQHPNLSSYSDRINMNMTDSSYVLGNRAFYNMPNTKIPNDQGAFMNWLYRNYGSCKSDNRKCDYLYDNIKYKQSIF